MNLVYIKNSISNAEALIVQRSLVTKPRDLLGQRVGTIPSSTAHFHMLYVYGPLHEENGAWWVQTRGRVISPQVVSLALEYVCRSPSEYLVLSSLPSPPPSLTRAVSRSLDLPLPLNIHLYSPPMITLSLSLDVLFLPPKQTPPPPSLPHSLPPSFLPPPPALALPRPSYFFKLFNLQYNLCDYTLADDLAQQCPVSGAKVTLVLLSPQNLLKAWQDESIAGGFSWAPWKTRMMNERYTSGRPSDGIELIHSGTLGDWGRVNVDIIVAAEAFASRHPKVVRFLLPPSPPSTPLSPPLLTPFDPL